MTQAIYQKLKEDGKGNLKVFTEENEKASEVWLQFGLKPSGSYRIKFISRDDGNDVAVRVFSLVSVNGEEQKNKVLPVLNHLNGKFRFFKFWVDDDDDVNVEYDYMVRCPDPAASAMEIVIRITQVIEEAYPELMRALLV